jgi:hypothetical protein
MPQQVALKALYGVPLDGNRYDHRGFNELDHWAIAQGVGQYDELGYPNGAFAHPYTPKKYSEGWFVAGRRAGKSDALASTIVAYEAALGGHEAHVRKGQQALCFQIAQDLRMARYSLGFIRATLESSPILAKLITAITADRIDLKTGLTVAVVPPTLKAVRGYANPVAVLDEVGVWYQDSDAANPDYEIWRAVKPGQLQFPNKMLVGISSPWNKSGLLYQYFEAGTDGVKASEADRDRYKDCLVWHGTTAGMGNPRVTRDWLQLENNRDPRAFERECLAVFQDSISGFLSSELLKRAVDKGVTERPAEKNNFYTAAIDPAFRHDSFALVIAHATENGVVIDVVRRWEPIAGQPINPRHVMAEMAPLLRTYRVVTVTSDQYHLDTLQQLALEYGYAIEGVPFTGTNKAGIYGNLQQLLNQGRLHLLDHAGQLKELRSLERTLTRTGQVQISAPTGQHDDVASATALAVHKTAWMLPALEKPVYHEPTYQERIAAQLSRKRGVSETWD